MKIAMFGTFDISNFGDILFPIVAEEMLRRADPQIELIRYSYRPRASADWHYDVKPIEAFKEDLASTDLVLIGGGHLVHSNAFMAPGYRPGDPTIPHPFGFWWLPALAARMAGVPVAFHALSVDPSFPSWARPLFESFAQSADYANARDVQSCDVLRSLGAKNVSLVPDSIFSIGSMMKRGCHSNRFEQFLQDHGMAPPYLIVQPSASLRKERHAIDRLIAQASENRWHVLELPIFQEKLNRSGLFENIPGVISPKYAPDPLLLAEIIANSDGVVGVSLHLSIVASVFGVPIYRKRYGANSKFILLDQLSDQIMFLDAEPELRLDAGKSSLAIESFQQQLAIHYGKLVQLAGKADRPDHAAVGWEMLKRTPAALRKTQTGGERVTEMALRLRRLRNFTAARLAIPIDRASSIVRASK